MCSVNTLHPLSFLSPCNWVIKDLCCTVTAVFTFYREHCNCTACLLSLSLKNMHSYECLRFCSHSLFYAWCVSCLYVNLLNEMFSFLCFPRFLPATKINHMWKIKKRVISFQEHSVSDRVQDLGKWGMPDPYLKNTSICSLI